MNLEKLTTETPNQKTKNLGAMSPLEVCKAMNDEDKNVPLAIEKVLPQIAKAIEIIANQFNEGGRLIYSGAGTSGRLGLLDAVECVPTFGTPDSQVIGLIAGGQKAFIKAVEGAEDSTEFGAQDLKDIDFNKKDVLVGIAASGRTPYVLGALEYANSIGAQTIAVSCNLNSEIGAAAKLAIEIDAGSEVLTGSTRLKAGTAQKLILNMLSTGSMVQIGKVYGNLMVDVLMTNKKLENRARRIIMLATGVDFEKADKALIAAGNKPKTAIVMILNNVNRQEAERILQNNKGFIK
ncbi:MAG: N-acetylmuramic acid 6-phosphate etherase [Elusimicrobiota bacterium]|jgi:N-acetylmuramic acid 6-phosphate etherase|nr:N-acetylmuramic acid 6-phosphate etherase [Elusimicrobiota bacterium]